MVARPGDTIESVRSVQLHFEQLVPLPRPRLFAFHTDPANLAVLLEGWPGFELRGHPGSIRPGSRVLVRQGLGPLVFELEFEHVLFEPPERFGERQVRGPFARFEHVHEFHQAPEGTRIVDRVDFALPLHLGGRVADHLIAGPKLRRFFAFRRAAYRRLLEAGTLS